MSKQKIVLALIIIIAVVGIVALGVKGLPKKETALPTSETGEPVVGPGGEPMPGPGEEPAVGPGEEPVPGLGEEPIAGPAGEIPGEPVPEIPEWQNPETPKQSPPMEESEIPKEAIQIGVSAQGFSPSTFEVKRGTEIVLSVTSEDDWMHTFRFKDKELAEVAMGIFSGETRTITFYAPKTPGEYEFYCSVPGHEGRGEIGKMIVK